MADNVAITAGLGTSIGTDDCGAAGHIQRVKVDGGGDGVSAPIAGDATNGLDVDVTRLPALVAGTANIGDVDVLTLPALVAGTANIGDVDVLTLPALATGANVIGYVREYLERSRLNLSVYLEAYVVTASDVLTTLQRSVDYVTPTGAVSHSVPAGKRWRFHSAVFTWNANNTTVASAIVRLRANTAGAAVVGSPVAYTVKIGPLPGTQVAQHTYQLPISFPDGIEFAASTGIGLTVIGSTANGAVSVMLHGHEYDA